MYGGLYSYSSTAPSNIATVSLELCLPVVLWLRTEDKTYKMD